jgi:hypothetical protein
MQVLVLGRNIAALHKLVALDPARVFAVAIKPDEQPLKSLKDILGQDEVCSGPASLGMLS